MGDRPTAEELAPGEEGRAVLDKLAAHGYRIVHPDDVPSAGDKTAFASYDAGWNACRAHIFGEGT